MEDKRKKEILDREVDYESMESFPASDPPSWTLGTTDDDHKIRPPAEQPTSQNDPVDD